MKPSHIIERKAARTQIYRAVFGSQDGNPYERRENRPWLDKKRVRPQDWSAQSAWGMFEAYKADAKLSREALIEIASVFGVNLPKVL